MPAGPKFIRIFWPLIATLRELGGSAQPSLALDAQDHESAYALFKQVRAERQDEWVREFQGALGPFDRGIFITTSVFTQQAEDQAAAPGYKPIDLIDGERLVELLIDLRLGIKDVTIVDDEFFAPYR